MAKAIKIAGAVVIGAGLILATGGIAAGFTLGAALGAGSGVLGLSIGGLILAGSTIATLGGALDRPKVPQVQNDRLYAQLNPREFRKTVLGQTALPVDVRHEEWEGSSQEWCRWIVGHASHGIDGVDEIWFGTEMAWSATTGVTAKYRGYFFVDAIVLEGTPANALALSNQWNGTRHLTGCAYSAWRFKTTGNSKKADSPFSGGPPSRITVIGRGAKLYDPRRDSTVPGGNGPMRADDQSTWRFVTDDGVTIGENLPLQILRVALGGRIRNPLTGEMRLATGSGVPKRRINMASFIVAANLADERVNRSAGGTEPRYHGACVLSEGDEPRTWFDMLCTACNARFRDTGGKLSIDIAHNDFAAAATDDGLTTDDVVGPHRWEPDASLEAIPNIVRGKYVDASAPSLYQLIDYPEIRISSLDGVDRILSLDLGAVESVSHAQRVGKQVLQRKQYPRTFTAPFDIRAWKYPVGALVPFTYAPLGFKRVLFRVREQELGQGGECVMTLSYEHASFYAWDADDRAPVMAADPIVYDNRNNPLILAIGDAARTAEWDQVTDPTGRKPQDNATVGAPIGTKIAGRPAENVVADLDAINKNLGDALTRFDGFKADLSTAMTDLEGVFQTMALLSPAVFDIAKLMDTSNAYLRARTTIDGMPIGTVVVETREKSDSAVEDLRLLGARSPNGGAFNLDLSRVMVDGRTSLSQKLRQIEAKGEGDLNARATDLISTIVDRDQASAKRISSLEVTAKGTTAKLGDLDELVASNEKVTAKRFETIELALDTPVTGLKATVQDLVSATLTGDGSLLQRVGVMESSLNRADTGVWARIGTAEQLLLSQGKAFGQRLDTLDLALDAPGTGLKTLFRNLEQATLTGTGSLAQRINTMESSLNTPETGVWARIGGAEQLILSQGKAFAQDLETVNAAIYSPNGGLSAQVAFLRQATVNASGDVEAKAVLALDANGNVSGLVATNNGKFSKIQFKFNQATFIRPDGTLLIRAGSVDAGEDPDAVYMPNVIVDRIRLGTVGTDELAASAIRKVYAVELGSNPALPNATGQRINYLTLYINKSRAESALRISYNMRPRPGRDYAAQFVLGRMPVNSDTKTDMDVQWYWGASAVINGFRSIRMPISLARTFDGIPAGEHLIIVDVIGYGGGNDQGFMEAGSSLYVEEVKR